MGTPAYMSPEQALGKRKELDERTDVYSLGAVLYELLTGRPPFESSRSCTILTQVVEKEPLPPSKISARVPKALENICLKAMAKEKEYRYTSALEFAQDLERFLSKERVLAVAPGFNYKFKRWFKENRLTVAIVLLLLLAFSVIEIAQQLALKRFMAKELADKKHAAEVKTKPVPIRPPDSMVPVDQPLAVEPPETKPILPQHKGFTTADEYIYEALRRCARGDTDDALSLYNQALEQFPRHAELYNYRGNLYKNRGKLQEAISDYNKALAMNLQFAEAYYNRGNARYVGGDVEGARADCSQAVRLSPEFSELRFNHQRARYTKDEIDEDILYYTERLTKNVRDTEAWFRRASSYYARSKLEEAITDCSKILSKRPNPAVYNLRGNSYKNQGNWQAAIADYTSALKLTPDDAALYMNRGVARKALGDLRGAIADYSQAAMLSPNDAAIHYNCGNARLAIGDWDGAINDYSKSIQLNPRYSRVYAGRGEAFKQKGDHLAASRDLRSYLELNPLEPDAAQIRLYIEQYGK